MHVDQTKPRVLGGKPTFENGLVQCSIHDLGKKMKSQNGFGRMMFINLFRLAQEKNDTTMKNFCDNVLTIYVKHRIADYISR